MRHNGVEVDTQGDAFFFAFSTAQVDDAPMSSRVDVAADGVVTQVGFVQGYDGYGSVVLLQHQAGYSTLYAHLSRPLVHVGEHVLHAMSLAR